MSRKEDSPPSFLPVRVLIALAFASVVPSTGLCEEARSLATQTPVATVNGSIVSETDLAPLMAGQLQQLRQQEYDLKSKAVDQLVAKRLLEVEATKQGISIDQLTDREVKAKVGEPTDSEVEAYYLGQRDRLQRPLSEIQSQLRQTLQQARLQQSLQQYISRLREQAKIAVLLEPPRVHVSDDSQRVRGRTDARITIVEFSDFHCPFCKRVQPSLNELLTRYDGKVRLVFRDMPLDNLHPQARAAAEAAHCAGDQGKFWEYHDLLFAQAPKASPDDLKSYAKTVGLNTEKFDNLDGIILFE